MMQTSGTVAETAMMLVEHVPSTQQTLGSGGVVLDFDSLLCARLVAKLDVCAASKVEEGLACARAARVELLYIVCQDIEGEAAATAMRYGAVLVDRRTSLICADVALHCDGEKARDPRISIWQGESTPALERVAVQAAEHSRFVRDSRMPRHVGPALYIAWIRNLCKGRLGSKVMFVAYDPAGEIAGVVTVGECDRAGEKVAALGLLAVDKASRRQGLGTALMRAAMEWTAAHKQGIDKGTLQCMFASLL